MTDLFIIFKELKWNSENLESLFSMTTALMNKYETCIPVAELYPNLKSESPVTHYNKRIHLLYKNSNYIRDRKPKAHYSVFKLGFMLLALTLLHIVGALGELKYFSL